YPPNPQFTRPSSIIFISRSSNLEVDLQITQETYSQTMSDPIRSSDYSGHSKSGKDAIEIPVKEDVNRAAIASLERRRKAKEEREAREKADREAREKAERGK
ncbi:hypothetical protein S7711_11488, partial [Stachybotrys chartarum IBT 7711]